MVNGPSNRRRSRSVKASVHPSPPGNVKTKFASVTTFWLAEKKTKSLTPGAFHELKINLNAFAAGGSTRTPLGELTARTQTPLAGFNGPVCAGEQGGEGRKWEWKQNERKEGREGRRKRGVRLCHLRQKFLRVPLSSSDPADFTNFHSHPPLQNFYSTLYDTAQVPPHCTKCNSPPINGQCTNHCIVV